MLLLTSKADASETQQNLYSIAGGWDRQDRKVRVDIVPQKYSSTFWLSPDHLGIVNFHPHLSMILLS